MARRSTMILLLQATTLLPCALGFDASRIVAMMNSNANPCDDFYEFACGNYPKVIGPLPPDVGRIDYVYELDANLKQQVKELLETKCYVKNNPAYYMIRKLYRGCKNTEAIERLGLQPLKDTLSEYGGWPTVIGESWDGSNFSWAVLTGSLQRQQQVNPIVRAIIQTDQTNATRRVINFVYPTFILANLEWYWDSKYTSKVNAYESILIGTAVQLGASKTKATEDAKAVIRLETALAKAVKASLDKLPKEVTFATLGEFYKRFPELEFDKPFAELEKYGIKIPMDQLVDISVAGDYLEGLPKVLKEFDSRTIANLMLARTALNNMKYLAPTLRKNYDQFELEVNGRVVQSRDDECLQVVQDFMQWPLSYVYVKELFKDSGIKDQVTNMVEKLEQMMQTRVDQIAWMDQATKDEAKRKLSTTINLIGYPDNILNLTFILRDYTGVSIDEARYYESAISARRSLTNGDIRKLLTTPSEDPWDTAPAHLSLSSTFNVLLYTISDLQPPLYLIGAPEFIQYGRLGADLASAVVSGLDQFGNVPGRFQDADGILRDWFSNSSAEGFEKRLQCLRDQYANITDKITGLPLIQKPNTWWDYYLVEDNEGVVLAYQTWHDMQSRMRMLVKMQPLKGLEKYTLDALFFVSYAQKLCSVETLEYRKAMIAAGDAPPNNYRVIVSLQNYQKFAEAFNCDLGTPMNPTNKCLVFEEPEKAPEGPS